MTSAIRGHQRGHPKHSEALEGTPRHSEALRGKQRHSETIRTPSDAIGGNQRQSAAHQISLSATRANQRQSKAYQIRRSATRAYASIERVRAEGRSTCHQRTLGGSSVAISAEGRSTGPISGIRWHSVALSDYQCQSVPLRGTLYTGSKSTAAERSAARRHTDCGRPARLASTSVMYAPDEGGNQWLISTHQSSSGWRVRPSCTHDDSSRHRTRCGGSAA